MWLIASAEILTLILLFAYAADAQTTEFCKGLHNLLRVVIFYFIIFGQRLQHLDCLLQLNVARLVIMVYLMILKLYQLWGVGILLSAMYAAAFVYSLSYYSFSVYLSLLFVYLPFSGTNGRSWVVWLDVANCYLQRVDLCYVYCVILINDVGSFRTNTADKYCNYR